MKIQGPNRTNFNPYQQAIQRKNDIKKQQTSADQLQISNEAKQLLENKEPTVKRQEKIAALKEKIQANEYEIDFQKTADKMIDYWSGQR